MPRCCWCLLLLTCVHLTVYQNPQVLFNRAAPELKNPQCLPVQEFTSFKVAAFCTCSSRIFRDALWWDVKLQNLHYTSYLILILLLMIIIIKKIPLSRKFCRLRNEIKLLFYLQMTIFLTESVRGNKSSTKASNLYWRSEQYCIFWNFLIAVVLIHNY